jgi:hypothetical protein
MRQFTVQKRRSPNKTIQPIANAPADFFVREVRREGMMDNWKPKLKLLSVLSTTKEFLLRSKYEGWPDEKPNDTALEIDKIISHILHPEQNPLPKFASILYLPTGSIQEIAMSNGWHDAYMSLSEEYDDLAYLIKEDHK